MAKTKYELVDKFLSNINYKEAFDSIIKQMSESIGLTFEYNISDVYEMVIDIYIQAFTVKNLQDLVEFSESETGKVFYQKQSFLKEEIEKRFPYILKVDGKTLHEHITEKSKV